MKDFVLQSRHLSRGEGSGQGYGDSAGRGDGTGAGAGISRGTGGRCPVESMPIEYSDFSGKAKSEDEGPSWGYGNGMDGAGAGGADFGGE
jgi:hypothetical protein